MARPAATSSAAAAVASSGWRPRAAPTSARGRGPASRRSARRSAGGASSWRSRASSVGRWLRRWRRGLTAAMGPPATVSLGVRTMQLSCGRTATGVSSTSWAQAVSPAASSSRSRKRTLASDSAVAERKVTPASCARGWVRRSVALRRTSRAWAGFSTSRAASTIPRLSCSVRMPLTLTAARVPGARRSTFPPWRWRPRMRPRRPPGWTSISWPTSRLPSSRVPVTTAPNPRMVKARSMGRRGRPRSRFAGVVSRAVSRVATRSSRPWRVVAEVRTMGAPSSREPMSVSATSSSTRSTYSSSARSHLVMATTPAGTSSRSRMARCSWVWGMGPSSAATTRRARSTPPAPASMFLMKRSWPGTSTMLMSRPEGRASQAKPRSMVRPRSFSSRRRSGSMLVRARTRALLPWST